MDKRTVTRSHEHPPGRRRVENSGDKKVTLIDTRHHVRAQAPAQNYLAGGVCFRM